MHCSPSAAGRRIGLNRSSLQELEHTIPAWLLTVVTLAVVGVGVAIAYRMYARQPIPVSAPVNVSGLTVAARNDLYGDGADGAWAAADR
ncbi:hypothetical protein MAUB1S_03377 [Mycolicibacterium aubagnense]